MIKPEAARIVRAAAIASAVIMMATLACLAWFWSEQDRTVFPGAWMELGAPELSGLEGAEAVELPVSHGAILKGWFLKSTAPGPRPLLIYFGGNAEEVTAGAPYFRRMLNDWSILLINYRGFGRSTGRPSEAKLKGDALTLYDNFAMRPGVDPARVVVMGRSLGTGIAVFLASERPVQAVVLVSPYDSIASMARLHYPLVPSLLIRHEFQSIALAPTIMSDALVVIATDDRIIPPRLSMRLARAWGGPVRVIELRGATHNNVYIHPDFWSGLRTFMQGLSAMEGAEEARPHCDEYTLGSSGPERCTSGPYALPVAPGYAALTTSTDPAPS